MKLSRLMMLIVCIGFFFAYSPVAYCGDDGDTVAEKKLDPGKTLTAAVEVYEAVEAVKVVIDNPERPADNELQKEEVNTVTTSDALSPAEISAGAEAVGIVAGRSGLTKEGTWRSKGNLTLITVLVLVSASLSANFFDSSKATGWTRTVLGFVNFLAMNFSSKAGK